MLKRVALVSLAIGVFVGNAVALEAQRAAPAQLELGVVLNAGLLSIHVPEPVIIMLFGSGILAFFHRFRRSSTTHTTGEIADK